MKIKSLNSVSTITLAFALGFSSAAWAQNAAQGEPVPTTVGNNPASTAQTGIAAPADDVGGKATVDLNKEITGPDSVLTKLKQNTSPVTINDMIAAQDVLTRLDLIGQIEEKMAKIEEARRKADESKNKSITNPAGAVLAAHPSPENLSAQANEAAINALKQAGKISGTKHSGSYAQVLTVSGTNNDYSALLELDGHQLNVKNGSTVPGMGIVTSITEKKVTILKPDGKTTDINFTQN